MDKTKKLTRCPWVNENELMIKYHDREWGVPVHNDKKLFEFLILEGAQAGLSWQTVLNKRVGYKKAFDNFNPTKISKYNAKDVEKLMNNPEVIRNRLKINGTVINAQKFLEVKKEFGSFSKYLWQFTGGKVIKNSLTSIKDYPTTSKESDAMSKDLKKRGFKFIGSTICYAFMQAIGMVNDHTLECFRRNKV